MGNFGWGRLGHHHADDGVLLLLAIQDAHALRADALTRQQAANKKPAQEYWETYTALRAERAHVEQLQRKVRLIQGLLTDYLAGVTVSF